MGVEDRIKKMLEYARQWIGTPYVHQGRQLGVGCDCAGVLVNMADRYGYNPQDMHGYSPIPREDQLKNLIAKQMKTIAIDEIEPGDIVLMSLIKNGMAHHIGLVSDYQGGLGVIHCNQMIGSVVEHALNDKWRGRIKHAFRFNDIYLAKNIDKTFESIKGAAD